MDTNCALTPSPEPASPLHKKVHISLCLQIVFFTVLSIMAPFPGVLIPSGFMLALLAFVYYRARNRMRLVGRVMQVAANALAGNTELAAFAVGANAVQLVPLLGFGAALFFLQSNGVLPEVTFWKHALDPTVLALYLEHC